MNQDFFAKVYLAEKCDEDPTSTEDGDTADDLQAMAVADAVASKGPACGAPPAGAIDPAISGQKSVAGGGDNAASFTEDKGAAVAASSSGAPPDARAKNVRKHRLHEYAITDGMDNFIGVIKVDLLRKAFNAHCCQLGAPALHDHRTPTMNECRLHRVGTKKPLGYLVQWLRQGSAFDTRDDHKDSAELITPDERENCRQWLRDRPAYEDLLKYEAEWMGLAWNGMGTVQEG